MRLKQSFATPAIYSNFLNLASMTSAFSHIPSQTRKWTLTIAVGSFAVVLYGLAGQVTMGLEPSVLSFSLVDRAVPFLPWTFWIYASVYLIYFASAALQRDANAFNKFLYGYVLAYASSALFFICVPTTFPRELFPLPQEAATFSEATLQWFRGIDRPTNCLPSMHVASAVMSTLVFYRRRPFVFMIFCAWAVCISVTTLTTKQHFFVDVVAGAGFGVFCHLVVFKGFRSRKTSSQIAEARKFPAFEDRSSQT